jgi:hypothetical protein
MIDVQNKPSSLVPLHSATLHNAGSVPAIRPEPSASPSSLFAMLSDEIFSVMLIVVVPTAFWCAMISGAASLLGAEIGMATLGCIALAIAGFLAIIRASMMIDRST